LRWESRLVETAASDRPAALLQKAKHYRDVALALRRVGEAYQEAGDSNAQRTGCFAPNAAWPPKGRKRNATQREPSLLVADDNATTAKCLTYASRGRVMASWPFNLSRRLGPFAGSTSNNSG